MRNAAPLEQLRELLGLLDGHGAHEHGLALLVALGDLVADRVELLPAGLVDDVGMIDALEVSIGRDHRDVELVDLGELLRLGRRRARHARQLVVHPEVVLQRDGGERLVLRRDLDAFLGLDRLVQAVRPAPARHEPPGELVDDDDLRPDGDAPGLVDRLLVLDDVVHVRREDVVRLEGLVDVVHQIAVIGEVLDAEEPLAVRRPLLGERDGLGLLVHDVVALGLLLDLGELAVDDGGRPGELGDDAVDLLVHRRPALRARIPPGDDQRGARLVDQDRVDLVDDRVVVLALDHLVEAEAHVVAEVVEPELVVRAVGDVRVVGLAARARPERGEPDVRRDERRGRTGTASRAGSRRRRGRARGRSAPSTGRRGAPGSR